jgi:hypothetical protein
VLVCVEVRMQVNNAYRSDSHHAAQ